MRSVKISIYLLFLGSCFRTNASRCTLAGVQRLTHERRCLQTHHQNSPGPERSSITVATSSSTSSKQTGGHRSNSSRLTELLHDPVAQMTHLERLKKGTAKEQRALASNLVMMASNLLGVASNLLAMASNLI